VGCEVSRLRGCVSPPQLDRFLRGAVETKEARQLDDVDGVRLGTHKRADSVHRGGSADHLREVSEQSLVGPLNADKRT